MESLEYYPVMEDERLWPGFVSYAEPADPKRQQPVSCPLYPSIENSDLAASPANKSSISPIFPCLGSDNSSSDWAGWAAGEQSPDTDLFPEVELVDCPHMPYSSIINSIMSPSPTPVEARGDFDDVAFGREGVTDALPLFTTRPTMFSPANTPAQPTATQARERRNAARTSLKRKSAERSTTPSSPRSSCSPPPHQRRRSTASPPKEDGPPTKAMPGPKKTAHNMIEKRYRTNINDKINKLRDAVPTLRALAHRVDHADEGVDVVETLGVDAGGRDAADDMGGISPAHKLNKATILSKATEYIALLERENGALARDNAALRNRLNGVEILFTSRSGQQRSAWH